MDWLAKILNNPDSNVRHTAVNCPVCWAYPGERCYKMGNRDGSYVRVGGSHIIPHSERKKRFNRKIGI